MKPRIIWDAFLFFVFKINKQKCYDKLEDLMLCHAQTVNIFFGGLIILFFDSMTVYVFIFKSICELYVLYLKKKKNNGSKLKPGTRLMMSVGFYFLMMIFMNFVLNELFCAAEFFKWNLNIYFKLFSFFSGAF